MGRRRLSDADRAFRTEVAQKFREAMRRRGLNQTQAAGELNITKQAFSQYVLEKATPQGEILARACAKWDIKVKYRDRDFTGGAFGAEKIKGKPEVFQMDLFKEPQVFENTHLIVTVARSQRTTLQVTIKMKNATGAGRSGSLAKTS